jgi:hypothetical protein
MDKVIWPLRSKAAPAHIMKANEGGIEVSDQLDTTANLSLVPTIPGHMVAQLVEALHYKMEGHRFNS